jgi:hypothetical protein
MGQSGGDPDQAGSYTCRQTEQFTNPSVVGKASKV